MIVGEERRGTDGTDHGFQAASLDLTPYLEILATPSTFGVVAIARAIILRLIFDRKFLLLSNYQSNEQRFL